jgi:hypothetical protein
MNYFVGYPPAAENRGGFDPNPYGWLLHPTVLPPDEQGGDVFLIGWGRATDSGVLVGYFSVSGLIEMVVGVEVDPGHSFPLPKLTIRPGILADLPRPEEGERRWLLPVDDSVGRELLKLVQKHLASTRSSVSLGKARTRVMREKSPEEQAEAIERGARSKGRIGQADFRGRLIEAFGSCAITGCAVEAALSAAHIWEYHQGGCQEVWNGILLRADIHLLFDRHLLRIFPGDPPIVVLDEAIREAVGYKFHLTPLRLPQDVDHERTNAVLRERWNAANRAFKRFPDPKPDPSGKL